MLVPKKTLLAAFTLGVCWMTWYNQRRSVDLARTDLPPLNIEPVDDYYRQIHMSGSLLQRIRSFEESYLRRNFSKAHQVAKELVEEYGKDCTPCLLMELDTGVRLNMADSPELKNLCAETVVSTRGLPRLVALCTYFDSKYEQLLKDRGINFPEPWKIAITNHNVPVSKDSHSGHRLLLE